MKYSLDRTEGFSGRPGEKQIMLDFLGLLGKLIEEIERQLF